jgi:hypothetical protein
VCSEHRVVFVVDDLKAGRGERSFVRGCDFNQVMQIDGLDGRAYVVIPVIARLDHLQVEVQLRARRKRDGHL